MAFHPKTLFQLKFFVFGRLHLFMCFGGIDKTFFVAMLSQPVDSKIIFNGCHGCLATVSFGECFTSIAILHVWWEDKLVNGLTADMG